MNHPKFSSVSRKQNRHPHVIHGSMDVYHFKAAVYIIDRVTQASRELNQAAHELENLRVNGFNSNEAYTLWTDKQLYEQSILAWGSIKKIGKLISQANPNNFNTYFENHQNRS